MTKIYTVSHKVTVTYTRKVEAESKAEAEAIAFDMGDEGAHDGAKDTLWKVISSKAKPECEHTDCEGKRYYGNLYGCPTCAANLCI